MLLGLCGVTVGHRPLLCLGTIPAFPCAQEAAGALVQGIKQQPSVGMSHRRSAGPSLLPDFHLHGWALLLLVWEWFSCLPPKCSSPPACFSPGPWLFSSSGASVTPAQVCPLSLSLSGSSECPEQFQLCCSPAPAPRPEQSSCPQQVTGLGCGFPGAAGSNRGKWSLNLLP